MSQYPDARFLTSADDPSQFVGDDGAETAFAGRSNAGKSSAINVIVNRRQFARTSKTPGRTQLVNFFSLGADRRLVDLPGYGFARVTDARRRHWARLLDAYFRQRKSLRGLLLIVDIRRGLTADDQQMMDYADWVGVPVHVLLTKADKLKRGRQAKALAEARAFLDDRASVQLFSAQTRAGVEEAREVLTAFLGAERPPDAG